MEVAQILAGYTVTLLPKTADAQIGNVTVKADWIASDLLAGTVLTGSNFSKISGGTTTDDPNITRSIGAIKISGQVLGTLGGTDSFGFAAEQIKSLSIGGASIALASGPHNDDLPISLTGDFNVLELTEP